MMMTNPNTGLPDSLAIARMIDQTLLKPYASDE